MVFGIEEKIKQRVQVPIENATVIAALALILAAAALIVAVSKA